MGDNAKVYPVSLTAFCKFLFNRIFLPLPQNHLGIVIVDRTPYLSSMFTSSFPQIPGRPENQETYSSRCNLYVKHIIEGVGTIHSIYYISREGKQVFERDISDGKQ